MRSFEFLPASSSALLTREAMTAPLPERAAALPERSSRRLFRALDREALEREPLTLETPSEPSAAYFASLDRPSSGALSGQVQEGWIYLDLSTSIGSADALRRLSDALNQIALERQDLQDFQSSQDAARALTPCSLILGLGNLMFTPSLIRKVMALVHPSSLLPSATPEVGLLASSTALSIAAVIATTPQTQLAALTAGLIVSERFPEALIQAARLGYVHESRIPLPSEAVQKPLERLAESEVSSTEAHLEDANQAALDVFRNACEQAGEVVSEDVAVTEFATEWADAPISTLVSSAIVEDLPTQRVTQTLRSGHRIVSQGHLVIVGDVHAGSEIIAAGDIIVWGELRGIAHAGAAVNGQPARRTATVRALRLEAIQLRIGDLLTRRPDRAHLLSPDRAHLLAASPDPGMSPGVLPEWAGVRGDEIKLYAYSSH